MLQRFVTVHLQSSWWRRIQWVWMLHDLAATVSRFAALLGGYVDPQRASFRSRSCLDWGHLCSVKLLFDLFRGFSAWSLSQACMQMLIHRRVNGVEVGLSSRFGIHASALSFLSCSGSDSKATKSHSLHNDKLDIPANSTAIIVRPAASQSRQGVVTISPYLLRTPSLRTHGSRKSA